MTEEHCPHCGGVVARTDKTCQHCQRSLTATADAQDRLPAAMPSSTILLILFGVVLVGLGVLMLSEATRGVGLISAGCFLAIWARILQAGAHHHNDIRSRRR